jgi:hypothetical protein
MTPEQERLRKLQEMAQQQAMSGMNPNPTGFNPEMLRANQAIPNPSGLGLGAKISTGLQNGIGKLGAGLFPVDPAAAQHMSAEQIQQSQYGGMMQMGLGMMANANKGLGPALASGYFGARGNQQNETKQSFQLGAANRAEGREIQQYGDQTRRDERNFVANRDDEMWMRDFRDRQLKEMDKYRMGMLGARQGTSGQLLDSETLDMAAEAVMRNPTAMRQYSPSWGSSGFPIRNQINQEVAKKLKEDYGMTPSQLTAFQNRVRSEGKSMDVMVKQVRNIEAFEGVAELNGQRLIALLDKIPDRGIPVVNGFERGIRNRVLGDTDLAEYNSVMQQFQTEVARIVNNPQMSGVLSDSARHEIQQIVDGKMTADQTKRVINRLFFEMQSRKSLLWEQINSSQGFIGGGGLGMPGGQSGQPGTFQTAPGQNGFQMTVQPGWQVEQVDE